MLKKLTVCISIALVACSSVSVSSNAQDTFPEEGTVKSLESGDLMCYVTLTDESGEEYNLGARFEICDDQDSYLDQKVQLTYEEANVNDCESSEPCGKTRTENIISEMEVIE